MRNYLFDRFGTDTNFLRAAPAYSSESDYMDSRSPRSALIWMMIFVVLILGLTATCVVLRIAEGGSFWPGSSAEEYDSSVSTPPWLEDFLLPPWLDDDAEHNSEPTIPRAPTGDGTVLTIQSERGESVSAKSIYEKALPSVVSVVAYADDGVSSGSGIIMSEDGYILTNYHIIDGCSQAKITTLANPQSFDARLVGCAVDLDIAVLKVEAKGLIPAEFGSSRALAVGDTAYALGNPLGYLNGSLSDGIISALSRKVTVGGYEMNLIQTTTPLNSGNSGGALLNDCGQVVGVTSAKISSNSNVTSEGLGLAIPISEVRGCINSILATGEVITPRIGIMCLAAEVDGIMGVLVDTVEEDGSAAQAGLLPGDLITAAEGTNISSVEELKDVFYDAGVGEKVSLSVMRNGNIFTVSVTLLGNVEDSKES